MPARRGRSRATRSPIRSSARRPTRSPTRRRSSTSSSRDQPREEYGRYGNPGEQVVEQKLAALEGGGGGRPVCQRDGGDRRAADGQAQCAATRSSSSTNATTAAASSVVKHLSRFGVVTHQVPACDYDAMEAAITPQTKLLISESPTNPHLSVVDLERFAEIGETHGVETLIDATLATPYNLRPIEYGVDYVLHSATKYLGGHNDLLAGVVVGTRRDSWSESASCAASWGRSTARRTATCCIAG